MGILILLLVIAAVIYLLTRLPRAEDADDAAVAVEDDAEAAANPGLPRRAAPAVPDTWVLVRPSLPAEEASVAQALLESHGVGAGLRPADALSDVPYPYPAPARRFSLYVAPEDAEAAFDLMARDGRVEPLPVSALRTAPDGWVQVGSYDGTEAQVVRGLLDTCGIRAAWDASGPGTYHARSAVGMHYRVYVSPDDADAARELLRQS